MRRRDFNLGLLAAGAAPLVPVPSLAPAAAAAPVAAAAPAVNFTPYAYAMSAEYARSAGSCSAATLASRFGLAPQVAEAIHARLLRAGVVLPNAIATREAVKTAKAPVAKPKPKPVSTRMDSAKARAKALLDVEEDETLNTEQSTQEPQGEEPSVRE